MHEYRFLTVWKLAAPRAAVCQAIEDSLAWPAWWHSVKEVVQLTAGNADGIGSVRRYTWRGRLPYRLSFDVRVTRMQPQTMVEGIADGDVEGVGCWTFADEDGYTVVRYVWLVRPKTRWMRWLHPFAAPLFRWNHDNIMRQGGLQLARRLNATLVEIAQH